MAAEGRISFRTAALALVAIPAIALGAGSLASANFDRAEAFGGAGIARGVTFAPVPVVTAAATPVMVAKTLGPQTKDGDGSVALLQGAVAVAGGPVQTVTAAAQNVTKTVEHTATHHVRAPVAKRVTVATAANAS